MACRTREPPGTDMGGMMTVFKVREGITTYEDPGWYQNPPGTVASEASAEDLKRDGIPVEKIGQH